MSMSLVGAPRALESVRKCLLGEEDAILMDIPYTCFGSFELCYFFGCVLRVVFLYDGLQFCMLDVDLASA